MLLYNDDEDKVNYGMEATVTVISADVSMFISVDFQYIFLVVWQFASGLNTSYLEVMRNTKDWHNTSRTNYIIYVHVLLMTDLWIVNWHVVGLSVKLSLQSWIGRSSAYIAGLFGIICIGKRIRVFLLTFIFRVPNEVNCDP